MTRFPVDAPKARVIRAFEYLGCRLIKEREHIVMVKDVEGGRGIPLTMPNHTHLRRSTLRTICTQAAIARDEFLQAYRLS